VATTLTVPVGTTHREMDRGLRRESGIDDGLVRPSIGVEEARDLVDEITSALSVIEGGRA
jgi:cystathionine beta-lyase/cystathionine gamma-synthase